MQSSITNIVSGSHEDANSRTASTSIQGAASPSSRRPRPIPLFEFHRRVQERRAVIASWKEGSGMKDGDRTYADVTSRRPALVVRTELANPSECKELEASMESSSPKVEGALGAWIHKPRIGGIPSLVNILGIDRPQVVAAPASALVVADIPVSVVSGAPTPMQVDGGSAPAVPEERGVKSSKSRISQQHLAAVTANVNTYVKKGRQIIGRVVTKVPASSLRSMWDKVP